VRGWGARSGRTLIRPAGTFSGGRREAWGVCFEISCALRADPHPPSGHLLPKGEGKGAGLDAEREVGAADYAGAYFFAAEERQ